jgi:uncharacterized protein (DUF1697 family)
MIKYVAFLRGINVGGHKLVKMQDLSATFQELGHANVTTYIQSGNVVFESAESDMGQLTAGLQQALLELQGAPVAVMLRTVVQLQALVKKNPFQNLKPRDDEKLYVTFLAGKPNRKPKLPLSSAKKDVEVLEIRNLDVFSISRKQNGRFGFPNLLVEKELAVPATTRAWATVCKMATY